MTTYEPGRIYSAVICGRRKNVMRTADTRFVWADEYDGWESDQVTDVRGPLVVLDPDDAEDVADEMRSIGGYVHCSIADKITAQVKPPLQVGWHEVKELPHPMHFGGGDWRYAPSRNRSQNQSLTSTHYIGPASGDQS